MATPEIVWAGILNSIQTAYFNTGLNPNLGVDWPTVNSLQAVSTGDSPPLVSLFDRGGAKNVTQAIGLDIAALNFFGTPGSTLTPAEGTLHPGVPLVLTGANVPFTNDAFYINFPTTSGLSNLFAEYITVPGDTLATALTNFAAAINAIDGLSATVVSSTVHITSSLTNQFPIQAGVVNVGSLSTEIFRWCRDIQITLWTQNPVDRQNYGVVLEQLFTNQEYNFGLPLSDGTLCRIMVCNDTVAKDLELNDIYRRDWILSADYAVIQTQSAWEVVNAKALINQ